MKLRLTRYIPCIILFLALAPHVNASDFYVAKNGKDMNVGSESSPWLTIQKAARMLRAGDTVHVKNGTYREIVTVENSGSERNYITFKAYPKNRVILDGTENPGMHGVFNIHGKAYIKLEGLEIRNNNIGWGVLVEHEQGNMNRPATYVELSRLEVHHTRGEPIQVRGNTHHITITNCVVHDSTKQSGIDIYQWDGGRPHRVLVRGCTSYNCPKFAGIASEQADDLLIEKNISYGNGLGIDIGSGKNNIIRNNIIYNCKSGIAISSNQDSEIYQNTIHDIYDEAFYNYYWSKHGEDHARNKYYSNVVYNVGFGIFESDAKPHHEKGPSTGHQFYNNLFYNTGSHGSYRTPFYFKGATDIKFFNNTIYMNKDYDALEFTGGAVNADVRNNIISLSGKKSPVIIESWSRAGSIIDYNCYHNRSGDITGPGVHSVSGDPKFIDPENKNFRLRKESPCIGAGSGDSTIPATDIGAYEYKCNANR